MAKATKSKTKKVVMACRSCHHVVDGEACVTCGSSNLTEDWAGYLYIVDPKRSKIAEKMNIDMPGRYALKVR